MNWNIFAYFTIIMGESTKCDKHSGTCVCDVDHDNDNNDDDEINKDDISDNEPYF